MDKGSDTTIEALEKDLNLLCEGGMGFLCLFTAGETAVLTKRNR